MDLKWHDFFEIGIDFIDADHKHLLKIMIDIKHAISEENYQRCAVLLQTLLDKAKEHFKREENFLEKVKYPGLYEHKIYHNELLIKAETTKSICEAIETDHNLQQCFDNMAEFLIDDILRGDIRFKSYLEYEGYLTA